MSTPTKQKIVELFTRFQHAYGHRWHSLVPDKDSKVLAMRDWRQQLAGLSDDEVEAGFAKLGRRDDDKRAWPPTSFEFRELCRPHREPYERVEFQGKALPLKPASVEFARAQLAKLRGQTRGTA